MIFIGIDIGKNGGIAIVEDNGGLTARSFPYSNEKLLLCCDAYKKNCMVYMEKVHAMPKQSPKSMFSFGESYGYIKGVLETLKVPYEEVSPQKWKHHYGLTSDKERSIEVAKHLFPKVNLKRTERSRVDDHNLAEALLIAEWGRRHLQGK